MRALAAIGKAMLTLVGLGIVLIGLALWQRGTDAVSDWVGGWFSGGSRRGAPTGTSAPAVEARALADLVERVGPSVVTVVVGNEARVPFAFGSGFLISSREIVTNHHVVAGAASAVVLFSNGTRALVLGLLADDPMSDLAILQLDVPVQGRHGLTLASRTPRPGDAVVVVGSPEGLPQTVSDGRIAALREIEGLGPRIQITAPISHGSSGGPVFNELGEVVGVAVAFLGEGQNLNFAVPADQVRALWGAGRFPLGPQPWPSALPSRTPSVPTPSKDANPTRPTSQGDDRAVIPSNELRIIAYLRQLVKAQNELKARVTAPLTIESMSRPLPAGWDARIDTNNNGVGEFGGFLELSGASAGRMAATLRRPLMSQEFRTLNSEGEASAAGYLFHLYLPSERGEGRGEPSDGFTAYTVVAAQAEKAWCCYAWPEAHGVTGLRTFFVNQLGTIYGADLDHSGRVFAPLPPGSVDGPRITEPPSAWRVVRR